MDETVTRTARLLSCLFGFALTAAVSATHAQVLLDPTRPPASIPGQTPADNAPSMSAVPVLQSVIIGSGRREAVIDGHAVKLGDRVGDARVVRITETEVVLRSGKDTQILRLFPTLEKRPAAAGSLRPGRKDKD
ncbi:MSHA biogenesis protein MshK [Noviherbaspirillum aridicola]|uniref:MSHA biogenesis protein MshK n=1 Tax=Noviherbaspirillum aridicola TaxID=2849687 RepID=UPI001EE5BA1D|nr:MSHA biogenesis protein MshK [Noviherbaspirillum aridicola]